MNENPEYNNDLNDVIEESNNTEIPTHEGDYTSEPKESKNISSSLFDYFEVFVISIITVLVFFSLFFRVARVDGSSMNQTLKNGEPLVISDLFYEPRQGDIIVFHLCQENGYNQPLVKRVIATEGQEVVIDITAQKVFIDGAELIEDYAYFSPKGYNSSYFNPMYVERSKDGHLKYVVTVPEGKLFVMGDNRNGSTDSRSSSVGFVDKDTVLGKALFRVSPFTIFK